MGVSESSTYGRRLVANCRMATLLAPNATASTMTTIISTLEGPGELGLVDIKDASSARVIQTVGSVAEGGRTPVMVDGGSETVAEAMMSVTAGCDAVVVASAVIVVAPAVEVVAAVVTVAAPTAVVAGLAVVAVRFAVVVVGLGLAVVGVGDTWQPGLPWPAGGLQVFPGWAVTGPANAQAASAMAAAKTQVKLTPRTHVRKRLVPILEPPRSHDLCSPRSLPEIDAERTTGPRRNIGAEAP